MTLPSTLLEDIARAPTDRPVLLLIRHAERDAIAAGDVGLDARLTDRGRAAARLLGAALPGGGVEVVSSPIARCVETAELLGRGAPRLDRRLGDPGAFIRDTERAWPWFRDHPLAWLVARQIEDDEPLPGFAAPADGVRALVVASMPRAGLRVAVTHDALLGVVAGRVLGRADLPLPGWLEGLLVWPVPGGFRVRYRGIEGAIDGETLCPRSGLTVRDGRIRAPNLELSVARHCNLACAGCSHLSPILAPELVDVNALEADLTRLATAYHAQTVKLMGGEPLLHPRLDDVIAAVRRSGVGERITLCTNGVLLSKMSDDLWRSLDAVAISRYPGLLGDAAIERARERARRAGTALDVFDYSHFRLSWSRPGAESLALVDRIWRTCHVAHRWRCHNLDRGRFALCPQALMLPDHLRTLPAAGVDLRAPEASEARLLDRLLDHLDDPGPLDACRHCLGTAGVRIEHGQRRRDWEALHHAPSESLVDWLHLARMEAVDAEVPQGCLRSEADVP